MAPSPEAESITTISIIPHPANSSTNNDPRLVPLVCRAPLNFLESVSESSQEGAANVDARRRREEARDKILNGNCATSKPMKRILCGVPPLCLSRDSPPFCWLLVLACSCGMKRICNEAEYIFQGLASERGFSLDSHVVNCQFLSFIDLLKSLNKNLFV